MSFRGDSIENGALGGREDLAHAEEQNGARDIPPRSRALDAIDELDRDPFVGIGIVQQLRKLEFTPVERRSEQAPFRQTRIENAVERRDLPGGEAERALDLC